jgi:hypothetical protein
VRAVRDADELLLPAVRASVAGLGELGDADQATARLAERYADLIDNAGRHCAGCDDGDCKRESNSWALRWIGPLLLDALGELGLSPAGRKRIGERKPAGPSAPSRIAQLRAAAQHDHGA